MKKIGYIVCAIVVAFFAFIIAIPIVNDNVAILNMHKKNGSASWKSKKERKSSLLSMEQYH